MCNKSISGSMKLTEPFLTLLMSALFEKLLLEVPITNTLFTVVVWNLVSRYVVITCWFCIDKQQNLIAVGETRSRLKGSCSTLTWLVLAY